MVLVKTFSKTKVERKSKSSIWTHFQILLPFSLLPLFYMCDSPFSQTSSYTLSLEPYLNTYSQQYQNIITIDKMPLGPLSQLVSHYISPKLSPFQRVENNCCKYAIRRNYSGKAIRDDYFLTAEDVPSLLSYVNTNGYTIDANTTKIVQKAGINKKMVCIFTYAS